MDYNTWYPHAYTPCQVDRINDYLMNGNGNYLIKSCNSCLPSNAFAWIQSERCVLPEKFNHVKLNCQGSFNLNKYLYEICEVASLSSTDCIGSFYNSGWHTNTSSILDYPGIVDLSLVYTFLPDKFYKVILYGDNTECPQSSQHEVVFSTKDCNIYSTSEHHIRNPVIAPNPAHRNRTLSFETTEQTNISIYLTSLYTTYESILVNNIPYAPGTHEITIDDSALSDGIYPIIISCENDIVSLSLVKN